MNNIFTALTREKTVGAILEFVLWCVTCCVALMSLIALAMGDGQVTWILLMLFSIGMAVLMVFRLREITMLYSVCAFCFLTFLVHYLTFSFGYEEGSRSPLNLILFILLLLLGGAVVACAFVQFFSRINLGTVLTILVLCDCGAMVFLHILLYALNYMGDSYTNGWHKMWMNAKGYWVGTVSFWAMLAVVGVFYACYFWGPIDSRKGKIIGSGTNGVQRGAAPAIQGVKGMYAGYVSYLQGGTATIGSGAGVTISISDAFVSEMHCSVRFNVSTGFYEVLDQSMNGVFLQDGTPLQKNVYNSLCRGSVICIGSVGQQFKLV